MPFEKGFLLGLGTHTCNPNTWEAEVGSRSTLAI